jgi:hypothetical protein
MYVDDTIEKRVRLCVVEALERMGSNEALRPAIGSFLRDYSYRTEMEQLRAASRKAAENLETGVMRFRLSKPPPQRMSISPRNTAPPKKIGA